MAGRVDIYKLSRKIHLVSSMIIISFLLMYIFSGIIMLNRKLFDIPAQQITIDTVSVEKSFLNDQAGLTHYLEEKYKLKGRASFNEDRDKNWIYNYSFPGDSYTINVQTGRDTIIIKHTQQERTFYTIVQSMHVLRGFKGGWPYTVWAILYDASCFAMIIFAITGIIIWYRIRKIYKSGIFYLLSGLIIPLIIMLLYMFSK